MRLDEPKAFLDAVLTELPSASTVPLAYAVMPPNAVPPPYCPSAQSDRHRAAGYFCLHFYKSISRCFKAEE
jgi:hypothetical protein